MRRIGTIVLATAALAGGTLVGTAQAHTLRYDSVLTAKFKKGGKDGSSFEGTLASSKAKCVAGRKVTVLRVVEPGEDASLASSLTDAAGDWSILAGADVPPGTYYARTPKVVLKKNSKHRHVCKRAVSEPITVK